MIKIAFFEDHPIVINSLKTVFDATDNLELLFCASNKIDLFQLLKTNQDLDVIIVDFLAEGVLGMEIYEYLSKEYPKVKVIAFTSMSSPILVENFLMSGVKGYVNKNQDTMMLIEAITLVYKGEIVLPKAYNYLVSKYESHNSVSLSQREIEIMQLIIKECTSSDIAEKLTLSVKTIDNHRTNIFNKLQVKNVAGMVREASKLGLVG